MANTNLRAAFVVALSSAGLIYLAVDAKAEPAGTGPIPAISEDDPNFDCRRDGNRVCGRLSPQVKPLVQRLAQRPGYVKPGQWVTPPGTVLVAECFAAYPGVNGRATPELLACLGQPDPSQGDPQVMTWHEHHVNHRNHVNRNLPSA